jgi:hypothetical protein
MATVGSPKLATGHGYPWPSQTELAAEVRILCSMSFAKCIHAAAHCRAACATESAR